MRPLFQRIFTSLRWFIGFVVVVVFIILFFWRLIDQQGFTDSINGFLRDLWTIFQSLIALFFIGVGLALMVGWKPFKKKKTTGH